MKDVLTPIAKSVLIPLGLSAGMSVADAAIQKNTYGSCTTKLIIWNEEISEIMKMVKALEECGLLINGAGETIKNEAEKQKKANFSVCY